MSRMAALEALLQKDRSLVWTQEDAIELAYKVEQIAPAHGCHVALTGGCLYKPGEKRKDCDLLFYRIRQVSKVNQLTLFQDLKETLDLTVEEGRGWVFKAKYEGKPVDLFFPEERAVIKARVGACNHRHYPGDDAAPRNSTNPVICDHCYEEMEYDINTDSWHHFNGTESQPVIINEADCTICQSHFFYDAHRYKYIEPLLCPTCGPRASKPEIDAM